MQGKSINSVARGVFTYGVDFTKDLAIQGVIFEGATSSLEVREGADDLMSRQINPVGLIQAAEGFWERSLAAAGRGERIVLGAFDGEALIATVTLILDCPPNQPHRAEIAKMMTRVAHRGRGAARALLVEAERLARNHDRWLLVLDTAEDEGAAGLYEKMGYHLTGLIPEYALKPLGGLTGTYVYWKRLA